MDLSAAPRGDLDLALNRKYEALLVTHGATLADAALGGQKKLLEALKAAGVSKMGERQRLATLVSDCSAQSSSPALLTGPAALQLTQLTGPPAVAQLTGPRAVPQLTVENAKVAESQGARAPACIDDLLASALGKVASVDAPSAGAPRAASTPSQPARGESAALRSYRTRTNEAAQRAPGPAAAATSSGAFLASYEWADVPDGAHLPPGLEVDLPLDGRPRRARIPPKWQLKLWVDDETGFWRCEVSRHAKIAALNHAAAQHTKCDTARLTLAGAALDERSTVEEAGLFGRTQQLSVDLRPPTQHESQAGTLRSGPAASRSGRWETINS